MGSWPLYTSPCPWEFGAAATVYRFLLVDEEGDRLGLYVGGGEIPWYVGYVAGSFGFWVS